MLDALVQSGRDRRAAERLLRKLIRKQALVILAEAGEWRGATVVS